VLKARSSRLTDGVALCDIGTTNGDNGGSILHLHSFALRVAQSLSRSHWEASISHEAGVAIAFVIGY